MPKKVRAKNLDVAEQRDLDVEIGFVEALLRRDDGWIDAMKVLGDDYTRRGRVREGLRVDERLARLCPNDATVFYNLACSRSLAGELEEAFQALDQALKLGYTDFKWLAKDPDMANLRKHPRYKEIRARFGATK